MLVKGGSVAVWSPDGRAVVTARNTAGPHTSLEIVPVTGGEARVLLSGRDPASEYVSPLGFYAWSADGRTIYYLGRRPSDGSVAIWQMPASGGAARLAVRFDDPSRPWHPFGFRRRGNRFYFTVGDRESDIWVADIEGQR
jgi:Tol biopolymer transport system component